MTSIIKILDQNSANQIAAGEVVERPVSVIKELVENSLDAKAKHIEIAIEGNGVPLMRVRDDGIGINALDLPLAILRHATSKISNIQDLESLGTLGFRGEALPSIASVAKMEIISRRDQEVIGMCLKVEGGEQKSLTETGCPAGTTVTVEDLFYNTPARLKFLKSTNTEFGLISDVITRLALARPDVAFTLAHPKQVIFQTSGRSNLLETIGAVLGNNIARRLIPIKASKENWAIEGFISPPDIVRSNKYNITIVVNGRLIRSNLLSRALGEAYHTLIPNKLYPLAVLHLSIPPNEYDVNVHPTKMDIRFQNEKGFTQFFTEEIKQILLNNKPVSPFEKVVENRAVNRYENVSWQKPDPLGLTKNTEIIKNKRLSGTHVNISETALLETGSAKKNTFEKKRTIQERFLSTDTPKMSLSDGKEFPNQLIVHENDIQARNILAQNIKEDIQDSYVQMKASFPGEELEDLNEENPFVKIQPLAQVFNTYILASDGQELVIIDQHAAHERINYERLLSFYKANTSGSSQTLLIPTTMDLTPQEEQLLLEYLTVLLEMGFIIEHFGQRTYLLRGIPIYLGGWRADELLRRFLDIVLLTSAPPTFDKLIEEWIYALACKESLKANENLSILEMQQLILELGKAKNPYTCPHGRPTINKWTKTEIEKRFYRI